MYENFDDLYNEIYKDFYKTCKHKELLSINSIPYKIDNSLKFIGQYDNGVVMLNRTLLDMSDKVRQLTYTTAELINFLFIVLYFTVKTVIISTPPLYTPINCQEDI